VYGLRSAEAASEGSQRRDADYLADSCSLCRLLLAIGLMPRIIGFGRWARPSTREATGFCHDQAGWVRIATASVMFCYGFRSLSPSRSPADGHGHIEPGDVVAATTGSARKNRAGSPRRGSDQTPRSHVRVARPEPSSLLVRRSHESRLARSVRDRPASHRLGPATPGCVRGQAWRLRRELRELTPDI